MFRVQEGMTTFLSRVVNSPSFQAWPTWKWEYLVAGTYLTAVTALTTSWEDPQRAAGQAITSLAVFSTFGHMSVGSRLEEAQERSDSKTVACYRKMTYFLVAKEALWLVAFVLLHAWTAIAGIPLFLFYPSWRKLYLSLREQS